jgi:hypothetical protein
MLGQDREGYKVFASKTPIWRVTNRVDGFFSFGGKMAITKPSHSLMMLFRVVFFEPVAVLQHVLCVVYYIVHRTPIEERDKVKLIGKRSRYIHLYKLLLLPPSLHLLSFILIFQITC